MRQVRSRLDIALGRRLRVGDELRHRDEGTVWEIKQLHRYDCTAELDRDGVRRVSVPFSVLRTEYDLVVPLEEAA